MSLARLFRLQLTLALRLRPRFRARLCGHVWPPVRAPSTLPPPLPLTHPEQEHADRCRTDEKRVEKLKADFAKRLLGYEKVLSKQKWIGSKDKVTFADISHLSYGSIVVQVSKERGLAQEG